MSLILKLLGNSHCVMAALMALALVAADAPAVAQRAALVVTDTVVMEPLSQTQPVQGRFVARRAGPVAAQTRGPVTQMHVAVGDRVTEGDTIAILDTDRLEAQVARRRAELAHSEAQLDGAKARHQQALQEMERMRRLRKSAAFSRARLADLTNAALQRRLSVQEFAAGLETSKAELALVELDLERSRILAPFSGVVSRRYTQVGAFVADGAPVVELIDDQSLEIEADVPGSRVTGLTPGLSVAVTLEGHPPLRADVRAVVPQENALSRTRAVRFRPAFDPRSVNAAAGAAVTVRVPVGAIRDVLTVHKDAVVNQGADFVFVVEDGKAVRTRVTLGEATGARFVVLQGLKAGAEAVIRGNERLRPGQAVTTGGDKGAGNPKPSAGAKAKEQG